MKSTKFYSFDECGNDKKVLNKLDNLVEDRKIEYEFVETDLIKIKDLSLTSKEIKELNQFLIDNDVIEDHDYDDEDDEDSDEDFYEDEEY